MDHSFPILNVTMLGKFSMTYGNQLISFKRNTATKPLKLLQILLYTSGINGGIPRTQLLEDLYGQEELSNVSNNLRVTTYRLKKILVDTGLPEYDYIQVENGIYRWNSPMKTVIDVQTFETLIETAKKETNKRKQIELLCQAFTIYRGIFLPELSGEDWVIFNSVKYKKLYEYAFLNICKYKKQHAEYESLLDLTTAAVKLYPFEEWHSIKIDAYIALNRYKEAQQYYEKISKMFFEELGVTPSEKMMNQFKEMSNKMGRKYQLPEEIKKVLNETTYETGAFYCTFPNFCNNYRLIHRIMERNGHSASLMICSLTNGQGYPLEKKEKLKVLSENLHRAIKESIRRGDSFTKYSPSQFLILLIDSPKEHCNIIFNRILQRFTKDHKPWIKNLEYCAFSVTEIQNR